MNGNNFNSYTPQSFQNMWVEVTCQPMYSKCSRIFRMLDFRNQRMRTAVVVAVATKINNKKVIYDGTFLRK